MSGLNVFPVWFRDMHRRHEIIGYAAPSKYVQVRFRVASDLNSYLVWYSEKKLGTLYLF